MLKVRDSVNKDQNGDLHAWAIYWGEEEKVGAGQNGYDNGCNTGQSGYNNWL